MLSQSHCALREQAVETWQQGWIDGNTVTSINKVLLCCCGAFYGPAGLADNVRLVRASLCINPMLQHQVTLFPVGLSHKNDTCWLASGDTNVGDGFTMCGYNTSEQAQKAA